MFFLLSELQTNKHKQEVLLQTSKNLNRLWAPLPPGEIYKLQSSPQDSTSATRSPTTSCFWQLPTFTPCHPHQPSLVFPLSSSLRTRITTIPGKEPPKSSLPTLVARTLSLVWPKGLPLNLQVLIPQEPSAILSLNGTGPQIRLSPS